MEDLKIQIETHISQRSQIISEKIVDRQYSLQPEYWKAFGSRGRNLSVRDTGYHLPFLTEAVLADDPKIFRDYVAWVKLLFRGLKFTDEVMISTLECTDYVLKKELPSDIYKLVSEVIHEGIDQMQQTVEPDQSYIDESTYIGKIAKQYIGFLLSGDRNSASLLILSEVDKGTPIKEIYLEVFQKSQYEVGRLWLSNQISVAKEHFCSAATQLIMSQLYPYLFTTERVGHKLVSACVGGELHEIGIRMVTDFFEMEGWDTYYLGANTPGSIILKAIEENGAEVVGLSIAMPYHRSILKNIIHEIKTSDTGKNAKILIGGNAINGKATSWEWFGADGYAPNARTAVQMAKQLISA
jgi:methanogenic corrinoid protein MtbC1